MRLFFDVSLCIIGQGIIRYTGHYHEDLINWLSLA